MRRRLAVAWLVTVLACAGETETAPAGADDGEQAAADGVDGTPPPTPAPDVGVPAPTWQPGVTVVEPGHKPEILPATPTLGTVRPLVIVVEASRTRKKKGRRWPRIRMTGTTTLTSTSPDAARRSLKIETVEATPHKAFDEAATMALTAALPAGDTEHELVTDAWSAVTSLGWKVAADPPTATEVALATEHALSHLSLPLPTEPIGRKGKLVVRRDLGLMGLPMRQTLDLTVTKVAGRQIELSGDVHYELDEAGVGGTALGVTGITEAHADGKLLLRIDLPSFSPVEMELTTELQVTGPDGSDKTWLDLSIDEDYVAMADRRVRLTGQFVQGGLVIGHVAPGTKVWFQRKRAKVSPDGDFLLGFGRNASDRALFGLQFDGAEPERHVLHVQPRAFPPERIDGLPQEWVDLDKATKQALAKSKKRIDKVRGKVTSTAYYAKGFTWPMKGKVTSTYGRDRFLNGVDKGPHWGVDIAAPKGKPVKAPAGGVVVFAEQDVPLSGNLVILDHGHGLTSSFLHLDKIKVKVGDVVEQGQRIATSGNTGRSTGPHLDWRMNIGSKRIDPQTIVDTP